MKTVLWSIRHFFAFLFLGLANILMEAGKVSKRFAKVCLGEVVMVPIEEVRALEKHYLDMLEDSTPKKTSKRK